MSTMLKLVLLLSRCHRLMRRSSALMYVSQSLFTLKLLMWYAWALLYCLRHRAEKTTSVDWMEGIFSLPPAGHLPVDIPPVSMRATGTPPFALLPPPPPPLFPSRLKLLTCCQGLTLVHVRAELEHLQDTFMS